LRRVDMMVLIENRLDALVRLHTPFPPGKIGGAYQPGLPGNLRLETFYGPNAGLTEVLIPAGYVATLDGPVLTLNADGKRYVPVPSSTPTTIAAPGLPFSLVFRAEPGREDVLLTIASAYEAASQRRVPPPAFGPISPSRGRAVTNICAGSCVILFGRRDNPARRCGGRPQGPSERAPARPAG